MADEKETREKLIESARKEFAEKGFMKASLRNICKNAGVTTGALYFFFKDKDDLFRSILWEPFQKIKGVMDEHYASERCALAEGTMLPSDHSDDEDASLQIIHLLYSYREDVLLLLTKAQGSSMENVLDLFVDISEKHYRHMNHSMTEQFEAENVSDSIFHWIAHMQIDTFVYILTHIDNEEDAIRHMKYALNYMISGWFGMFKKDTDKK